MRRRASFVSDRPSQNPRDTNLPELVIFQRRFCRPVIPPHIEKTSTHTQHARETTQQRDQEGAARQRRTGVFTGIVPA